MKGKIKFCSCKHEFQDERYGKKQRVHNYARTGYGSKQPGYRCTVCTRVKAVDKTGDK